MQTDYEKHEKIAKADLPKMCELTTRLQSLRNEMLKSQSGINLNTTDINEIPALNLVKEYAKEML